MARPARSTARHASPGRHVRRFAILLGCLLLTGCSMVGMLYERADLLVAMQADSWLDLERAQRARLRESVADALQVHRARELPRWSRLLQRMADDVERGAGPEQVLESLGQARDLYRASVELLLDPLADTLAAVSPEQRQHLRERMQQDNEEYAEEFLDPEPGQRAEARVRRTREAIERWSGRLDPAQRALVAHFMNEVPDGAEAWRDYRLAWQSTLLARLRAGDDRDALHRLLHDWWLGDAGMDPEYLTQLERNRQIIANGLAQLFTKLSDTQRERAARRLRNMARDLETLVDGTLVDS